MSSQARQPYPDSDDDNGMTRSSLLFGADHRSYAKSSASGKPLTFAGTPPDDERTVLVSELAEEVIVQLQPTPWGDNVEDSRKHYPGPWFPAPLDAGGNVKWLMNEEEDFKNSVYQWYPIEAVAELGCKSREEAAEKLWKERRNRKIEHWLTEEAPHGTFRHNMAPAAGNVELIESAFREESMFPDRQVVQLPDGRKTKLPPTAAFPVAASGESSSSISLIIGGKGEGKGRARQPPGE